MNMLNRILQFEIQMLAYLSLEIRKFWQLTNEITAGQQQMKATFILPPG